MPEIKIINLTKSYNTKDKELLVLDKINLTIPEKSCITVEGRSGSGKTTFLNIIGTIDNLDSGEIIYNNQIINNFKENEKEKLRSKTIGFIFQHHYLLPDFNILENVMIPLLINGISRIDAKNESLEILKKVKLEDRKFHFPNQISGGEMARVGVARALVGDKKIILADEPTGNLDRKNADNIIKLILELQKSFGFTLILVTHDTIIAKCFKKRYQLQLGKLCEIS